MSDRLRPAGTETMLRTSGSICRAVGRSRFTTLRRDFPPVGLLARSEARRARGRGIVGGVVGSLTGGGQIGLATIDHAKLQTACQQSDLDFWRSGVTRFLGEFLNDFGRFSFAQSHIISFLTESLYAFDQHSPGFRAM